MVYIPTIENLILLDFVNSVSQVDGSCWSWLLIMVQLPLSNIQGIFILIDFAL